MYINSIKEKWSGERNCVLTWLEWDASLHFLFLRNFYPFNKRAQCVLMFYRLTKGGLYLIYLINLELI